MTPPLQEVNAGYVRIYRRLWTHSAFRNLTEAAIFAWLIADAQWRPRTHGTRLGAVHLEAGEVLICQRGIAQRWGISRKSVRTLIERLEAAGMVSRRRALRDHNIRPTDLETKQAETGMVAPSKARGPAQAGTILTIKNYSQYQSLEEDTLSYRAHRIQDDGPATGPTAGPPRAHRGPENKTLKEGKKGKKETPTESGACASDDPDSPGPIDDIRQPDLLPGAKVHRIDPDRIEEAIEVYNAAAARVGLPRCQVLTPTRRTGVRLRMAEAGGFEGWATAIQMLEASDFLCGRVPGKAWRADIDFLLRRDRFAKLMEGGYASQRPAAQVSPVDAFRAARAEERKHRSGG